MAAHAARVAFCTPRAAAAAAAGEEAAVVQPAGEDTWVMPDTAGGSADEALLHGASSYLSMLHDRDRNEAYDLALRAAPAARCALDLGAGTGLLAMLACSAAPGARAVACEVYGECAELARRVVKENGLADRVTVVSKTASDLEVGADLPERADLCVFELFDSQLLGESIIPILRDAHARLLRPGATLVPRSASVHARLVACPSLAAADLPELRGAAWPLMLGQLGLHDGGPELRALSEPWQAAALHFADLPPEGQGPRATVAEVRAIAAGVANAVAWWWELDMGGGRTLSSWTPRDDPRGDRAARHHWRPCLSFLPPRELAEGAPVAVSAVHDDDAVWFAWHDPAAPGVPRRWLDGVTTVPPERERLLAASAPSWRPPLCAAARALGEEAARRGGGSEVLLFPAEDGLLLPPMASAALSAPGAAAAAALPARAGRRLREAGSLPDGLRLLDSRALESGSAEAALGTVSAILVEPCGRGADCSPWGLLLGCRRRLMGLLPGIRADGCGKDGRARSAGLEIKALPAAGSITAMLVECRGAWLARQPLGDVCGLRLQAANARLVPARPAPLDCQLCELAWAPLSEAKEALALQLPGSPGPWRGTCTVTATATGECHGVVLWAEFDLGFARLSTGPPPPGSVPNGWTQALQLAEQPFAVHAGGEAATLTLELHDDGEMRVDLRPATARHEEPDAKRPRSDAAVDAPQ